MEQPTVTKGQVNRSGKVLRDGNAPAEVLNKARNVLAAWRNTHMIPSADISMLLGKYTSNKGQWPAALLSRRMKRMPFIIGKLRRFPVMEAGRMQDIGGVRVVADTVQDVYALYHAIAGNEKCSRILELPPDDCISRPKADGYRRLHQVFRYASRKHPEANGLRIELQIRTRLQHVWATTVGEPAAKDYRQRPKKADCFCWS